jgi:hypothetical protein
MIVEEEQWISTVTVTVKSMISRFMMTVMIMFRYDSETVCIVTGTEDTSTQMVSGLNMCSKTSVSDSEYLKNCLSVEDFFTHLLGKTNTVNMLDGSQMKR